MPRGNLTIWKFAGTVATKVADNIPTIRRAHTLIRQDMTTCGIRLADYAIFSLDHITEYELGVEGLKHKGEVVKTLKI